MFRHHRRHPRLASSRPHPPAPFPPVRQLALPVTLLLALALANCGAPGEAAAGGTSASATPTNPPIPGRTAVRPCPGPVGSASDAGTPALILTRQTPNTSGTARVGQLVQVRLPTTQHWELDSSPPSAPLVGQGGVQDETLHACVWTFQPSSAGQIALSFVGTAICEGPGQPCPQYALAATFTVNVRQ